MIVWTTTQKEIEKKMLMLVVLVAEMVIVV
jgi:hypothetical protein